MSWAIVEASVQLMMNFLILNKIVRNKENACKLISRSLLGSLLELKMTPNTFTKKTPINKCAKKWNGMMFLLLGAWIDLE